MRNCVIGLLLGVPLFAPALNAQVQQPGQLASRADSEPLTVGEKYKLAWTRTVDPMDFARITAGAAIDQYRSYPEEWGQGWDAFGVRIASGFGQHLIKEQIEFGVWAIDHEDPRHYRSGLHGFWPRTRYAVIHSFINKRDGGGYMPAYSRFIGDYGAGFISREWYPTRFHNFQQGFDAGSISLGFDVGTNVLREFMPHWLIH